METENNNKKNQESNFTNIGAYGNERTTAGEANPDKQDQDSARDANGQGDDETDNTTGSGFAKPQKDDWPDEDESIDHPGGPAQDR